MFKTCPAILTHAWDGGSSLSICDGCVSGLWRLEGAVQMVLQLKYAGLLHGNFDEYPEK